MRTGTRLLVGPARLTGAESLTGQVRTLKGSGTLVVALTADDQARLHHHLDSNRNSGCRCSLRCCRWAPRARALPGDVHGEKQLNTVYRIVDVVGVSEKSWEDAGRNAVETAAESLRDLRVAEVTKMDMKVENGKVTAFRARVSLSFKYES
jgi:dodecin